MTRRSLKKFLSYRSKGFTLIEFIVIISIFAIMAGIVLFRFRDFSSNVSVNNLAHDLALNIRQAQIYGISAVTTVNDPSLQEKAVILFPHDGTNPNVPYPGPFVLFVDANSNGQYDGQPTDTDIDRLQITGSDVVAEICTGSGPTTCSSLSGDLMVMFTRPKPDALIVTPNTFGENYARITVLAQNAQQRCVEIWSSGMIDVKNCTPIVPVTP